MRVQMVALITGTFDGVDYPAPGEVGEFRDDVAADMIANGYAIEAGAAEEEHATVDESDVEIATTRRRKRA